MVDVVEDVAGKEAAEDEDWEPMAATITAAQALQCMCTVDPLRSEKQIRSAMTKAFGKNALVANKKGQTITKLIDSATISVGDLGTNLTKLNIDRKWDTAKSKSQALAKMFPSMKKAGGADRATQAAHDIMAHRGPGHARSSSPPPEQAEPQKETPADAAADALFDAELSPTEDPGRRSPTESALDGVLDELGAAD